MPAPKTLREPGLSTTETRAVVRSGSWGMAQQAATMAANSLVSILLIRALTKADYGVYAYATSLAGLGLSIMTAGLSGIAVKTLVDDRPANRSIMTTLVLVREAASVVGFLAVGVVALTSGQQDTLLAALLAGVVLFTRSCEAPEMWYTSRVDLRPIARTKITVVVLMLAVRAWLVAAGAPVWVFLLLFVLESVLTSVAVTVLFLRDADSPGYGRPSLRLGRRLVRESWPLMLAAVANQANLRSDVIVIQAMLGSSQVAVYAAASRVSEIAYFLPVVFMNSTFPVMLAVRRRAGADSQEYRDFVQKAYDRAFWTGVGIAVAVGLLGAFVVVPVFGPEYALAKRLLLIQVMACPFVFMAAVFSKWIVAEGRYWLSVGRHLSGAAVNVALNVALLPRVGITGAAVATLVSYTVASYASCFFGRQTRSAAWQMTLAIVAPLRWLRTRSNPRGRL